MDIGSALHDDIPQILFLYALPSAPDGGIVDVLHLRNFYKAKTGHVVIQRFGFGNSHLHFADDRIDLGIIFDLLLCLKVNRSIDRRALFDADGFIARKILLFDVPQSVTVAGKADSPCQYKKKYCLWIKKKPSIAT